MALKRTSPLAGIFDNVHSAPAPIREIDQFVRIHKEVIGFGGFLAGWGWRYKVTDLSWLVRITDVCDTHAGIEPGGEYELLALEAVGVILMHVVRAEAQRTVVEAFPGGVLWRLGLREATDHDRLTLVTDVDNPDPLVSILLEAAS